MTEWPKNPEIRLIGGTLEPVGPMNVFNEKLAVADAVNRAINVKTEYDEDHLTPPAVKAAVPAVVAPTGTPAGAGKPVPYEAARYMVDVMLPSPSYVRRRR